MTVLYDADRLNQTARRCGECTLCCKLTPVRSINKPANTRCEHQRFGKGCAIYATRPRDCRLWSCAWLAHDDTAGLRRPDRSHYVIDVVPDFVTAVPHDGSPPIQIPVIQVWVDPLYPDAHEDPALRAWLAEKAALEGMAAMIRYGSEEGFVLAAPAISQDGQWHRQGGVTLGRQHTAAEVAAVMAGDEPPAQPVISIKYVELEKKTA